MKKPALVSLGRVSSIAAVCFLAACVTPPPQPKYEYADGGLALTSEPSGARVEIGIQSVRRKNGAVVGSSGTNEVFFVTPHLNANDKLIRHATLPDGTSIEFKYTVRVSRGGYKPVLQVLDGREIKPDMHWVLEPTDARRLAAASNAPAAWVRVEKALLNGRPLAESYPRFQDIRHYLADFVTVLVESNLFVAASTERSDLKSDRIVEFALNFDEKENRGNVAAGMGQAFASGFLTLGTAPVTGKYAYESAVAVNVVRWDGKSRHYTSKAKLTSRWVERPDGSQHAHRLGEAMPSTRKHVTAENLSFLAGKAVQDADFYSGKSPH